MNLTKRKLIILAIAFLAVIGFVMLANSGGQKPSHTNVPSIQPTATPTADPLSAADRVLLTRLSTELATKFRTFQKPDGAYVESIKPYLAAKFLDDYRSTLRYADRAPFLKPVRSQATSTEVSGTSPTAATAHVALDSTMLQTQQKVSQVIRINWQKIADRWVATDVEAETYSPSSNNG
jgi:hypothetical protein